MSEVEYDWNWHPKSKAEAEAWATYDSHWKRENVAKSEFADESIIKEIASHNWGPNDSESSVLAALTENPNLTPELREWLDAKSSIWSLQVQHVYWLKRYGVDQMNSSYDSSGSERRGPVRKFAPNFINSKLDFVEASKQALEIADQFMEQMWYDLAQQNHLTLSYTNIYRGAEFLPADLGNTSEEILNFFSPGYFVTWVDKEDRFDFDWARERAEDDDGNSHFEENTYVDYIDEPYCGPNLGLAIGAGVEAGDLKVLDLERYEEYLEEFHSDDSEMYEVTVTISKESPWQGTRYFELSDEQKMNLILNFIATLKHPYLGRSDGICVHLLECLAKHDQTPDSVKALITLQLGQ